MSRRALPLAILGLFALAACDGTTPTQPLIDLPGAGAPSANHGSGVQFTPVIGPLTLTTLTDGSGNACNIGFSAQQGGQTRSDFYRTNVDSSETIHTTDPAAPLTLNVDGVTYQGVGHATAYVSTNADQTDFTTVHISANGAVTDPEGKTHQAQCIANGQGYGTFSAATITVH